MSQPLPLHRPGDIVFCHGPGFVSRAIRVAQAFRFGKELSTWNHVGIVVGENQVVQATDKGVLLTSLECLLGGEVSIVPCPVTADPQRLVHFVTSQVGRKYGFLTLFSILLNLLTPRFISFRHSGTWICSALAAGGLFFAGFPCAEVWPDCYQLCPAELYQEIG